jgi:uncharacterized membrane protein YsdA (DUF1294 family)
MSSAILFGMGILFLFNMSSFLVYWYDKNKAIKNLQRISEKRLLQFSLIGPIGSMFGIWLIRHKNKKWSYLLKWVFVFLISLVGHFFIIHLLLNEGNFS